MASPNEIHGEPHIYFLPNEREEAFRLSFGDLYALGLRSRSLTTVAEKVAGFVLSPDGTRLAFTTPGTEVDSLFVLDLATGSRSLVGAGFPVAFSPGGDTLLYDLPDDRLQLVLVPLAGGNPTPLSLTSATIVVPRELEVRWLGQQLQVLYGEKNHCCNADEDAFYIWQSSTNAAALLWRVPDPEFIDELVPRRWSPSGEHVAVWTTRCYKGLHDCSYRRYTQWLIDPGTGVAEPIARSAAGTPVMSFSPEGDRLAYAFKRETPVVEVYVQKVE